MRLNAITQLILGVSLAASVNTAYAETEDEKLKNIEVINVTGIRSQLTKAAAKKRHTTKIVDAISSDDMGKLPDTNVAESLQRVSGVQLERGIGEGSTVSIRGLSQNVILFNGREITTGGGRGDKGPDTLESSTYSLLSLVPSSLISSLEVSKVPTASDIEGALGGTVNIQTRKPLDSEEPLLLLSGTGSYNEMSENFGTEFSAFYSRSFLDHTLGFQIGLSSFSNEFQEDGLNTFSGYAYDNTVTANPEDETLVFRDMRYWQINDERDRTGLTAMLQWAVSDDLEIYLDTFRSKVDSDRERYWTGFWNCCGYENTEITENGVLVQGTVQRPVQTNSEFVDATAEFQSSALGFKYYVDNWKISGEYSYTDSENDHTQDFIRFQTAESASVTYDLTHGNDTPDVVFQGADLTTSEGLNLAILFDFRVLKETEDSAAKLDFEYEVDGDFLTSVEFGGRINNKETTNQEVNRDIRPNFTLTELESMVPSLTSMYSNNDFFSGDAPAVTSQYVVADNSTWVGCETISAAYDDAQAAACAEGWDDSRAYKIEEDISSLYLKANFETEWGDVPVSGNAGVRYISRDLTSTGFIIDDATGGLTQYSVDKDDTEVLPSLLLKFDYTDELVFRLAASKTLSFPNTADLTSGVLVRGDFSGTGGNPELEPFIINQIDFTTEWYFDESALLSAGLFYKDVDSFIVNTIQPRDIPGYSQEVFISQPINGEGGKIQGLELLYQQPFSFLPSFLSNTGIMATYSYIDSETPFEDGRGNALPLAGLSENNINFVAYYETEKVGVRLAYNWRDEYLGYLGSGDNGVFYKDYSDLALTANYKLSEDTSINFEAVNLLDTRQKQYAAFEEAIQRNVEFGTSFKVSFSTKF